MEKVFGRRVKRRGHGAGYVGLVTGACLAHVGHRVVCADRDEGRVAKLGEGWIPIYEPGLEELVAEGYRRRRLSFSTDLSEVVHGADVVFIAVDTPQGDDGSADLSSVGAVARSIILREISGRDLPPTHGAAKPGEQLRSSVDPTTAARVLGWRPETDLKHTLIFFGATND